jgi:pimeloyl-ACP methyl ester carboxylesterase
MANNNPGEIIVWDDFAADFNCENINTILFEFRFHGRSSPSKRPKGKFHCIGPLRRWSVVDQVHQIEVPTLLLSGLFDEVVTDFLNDEV